MAATTRKVYTQDELDWDKSIVLDTPEGQELLKSADMKQTLLLRIFSKQEQVGLCGIQSPAMLMSARVFGQKYPDPAQQTDCDVSNVPYVDYKMFAHAETTRIITKERVLADWMTLAEVAQLLHSHGIPAKTFYVHGEEDGVEDFRARAIDALSHSDSSHGVMVNFLYKLKVPLDDGTIVYQGHHSLLGAYHKKTDMFLVKDTIYEDEWYFADELFKKMSTFDDAAGQTRGFLIMGLSDD